MAASPLRPGARQTRTGAPARRLTRRVLVTRPPACWSGPRRAGPGPREPRGRTRQQRRSSRRADRPRTRSVRDQAAQAKSQGARGWRRRRLPPSSWPLGWPLRGARGLGSVRFGDVERGVDLPMMATPRAPPGFAGGVEERGTNRQVGDRPPAAGSPGLIVWFVRAGTEGEAFGELDFAIGKDVGPEQRGQGAEVVGG